ncbi:NUDIX domain-containing protein [Bacillus sp. ISL-46]|uniref:NUDIX domain-containing protein n=1 Tax=Bacillus sp. ISL-46 TaxID=2819129 RepID=UPI001BEA125B|nr:NUDIX domain-containing protein [Bacillus sp. ISL-46]MBT2723293.1 NUDIX domain-containing protein [Bacillus sp. ISL-46]
MNRTDYYYDQNAPKANNIVPAVSAVILRNHRDILLQERVDNGMWSLPGGGIEPGETVEDAIKREVMEETGFAVVVKKLIGIYSDPNHVIKYADGEVRQQFSICFLCEVIEGSLKTSHESKRVEFVPLCDLDTIHIHEAQMIRIQDALSCKNQPFLR